MEMFDLSSEERVASVRASYVASALRRRMSVLEMILYVSWVVRLAPTARFCHLLLGLLISHPEEELQLLCGNDLKYNFKILKLSKTKLDISEPTLVGWSENTTGPLQAAKLYWLCSKKAHVKRCVSN